MRSRMTAQLDVVTLNGIPVFTLDTLVFEQIPARILFPTRTHGDVLYARRFKQGEVIPFPGSQVENVKRYLTARMVVAQ